MTEETPTPGTAPGSGAGDPAQTQQIPHIPKPAKKVPARGSTAGKSAGAVSSTPVTDKGRPRATPISDAAEMSAAAAVAANSTADADEPLSAADYARTTRPSPARTSVIPTVKNEAIATSERGEVDSAGRQASLRLNYIEPWSVTRLAFAISVAMMIVGVVAVTIFWVVLSITGVWGQVNDSITSVLGGDASDFDITDYLGFWRLIGLSLVLSAINVVLMTALATIAAHLYNLAAQLLGGVEVTFGEDN